MRIFLNHQHIYYLIIGLFLSSVSVDLQAKDAPVTMADSAVLSNAWARATFALAKTGAAYLSITNSGKDTIHLQSVSVANSVADMAELHHTQMHQGMMKMQELEDGIELKGGETVVFEPGGKHIMLMGLSGPLNEGEQVLINFSFSDGSTLSHNFLVKDARTAAQ